MTTSSRSDPPSSTGAATGRTGDDGTRSSSQYLWAAICASFVSFLDGSVVNVALPAIARDLGGGLPLQQWVVDAYLLALGALILIAGSIADAFGRIRVTRIALIAFLATSTGCALSPTPEILIAARALEGVAGAVLVPSSLSLIIWAFTGAAQERAIGRWTSWTSVAFLIGPVTGGLLVDVIGWRWVFIVSAAPGLAALWLLGRSRDSLRAGAGARIDLLGAVFAAVGLGGTVFALIEQQRAGWTDPRVLVSGVIGVAGLILFVVHDVRVPHALVPPVLFRARNFTAGNLATAFVYGAIALGGLLIGLFLQESAGLPAALSALTSLPIAVSAVLLSGRFGALSAHYGPRRFMTIGPLIAAAGFFLMWTGRSPVDSIPGIIVGAILLGVGVSVTAAPLTAAVLRAVPPDRSGIGSAVNNAVARVAGLVATASIGLAIGSGIDLAGFHRGVTAVGILFVLGGVTAFIGIRDPPRVVARS